MKKIFTLFFALILFATVQAQEYVNETFDQSIPTTWTITSEEDTGGPWFWDDGTGNSIDGTGFAMVDSDADGNGFYLVENLEAPAFDASAGNIIIVSFDQYYNNIGDDFAIVQVWDGTEWHDALTQTTDVGSWSDPVSSTVIISDYVNPSGDTKVRFHYDDADVWAWYWAIDNVVISSVDCLEPQQLTVEELGGTSVTVSWNSGSGSSNLAYGPSGFDIDDIEGSGGTLLSMVSSPYTIEDLDALSDYEFYVQDDCGVDGDSEWSGPVAFSTLADGPGTSCSDPIILNANLPYSESTSFCGYGNNIEISNCFPFTTTNEEILFAYSPENDGESIAINLTEISGDYAFVSVLDACPDSSGAECIASGQSGFGESTLLIDNVDLEFGNIYYIMISTYSWSECLDFNLDITLITCPTPTDLSAISYSDGSADLSWTSTSGAANYQVEWGIAGFIIGEGTTIDGEYGVDDPPITIDGLLNENQYEFYVIDFCGFGDASLYAGPFEFSGPPPLNNLCADAVSIECGDVLTGNTTGATTDGNPTEICTTTLTAPSVWYTFIGDGNDVILDMCGSTYDTKLHLFKGDDCESLECVAGNDDNFNCNVSGLHSYIYAATEVGESYYVIVSGYNQNMGVYTLDFSCITCGLITNLSTSVSDVSANVSWTTSNTGAEYVLEYGPQGFIQGDGTLITGIVDIDGPPVEITGLSSGESYDVYVYELCSETDSNETNFTSFTTNPLPPPANDNCANAVELVEDEVLLTTNLYASTEVGEPVPPATGCNDPNQMGWCNSNLTSTTWYSYTPETSGMATITTCHDVSYDTQLAVYTGECGDYSTFVLVAANDDNNDCSSSGLTSTVSVCMQAGTEYFIQVDPYSTFGGDDFSISLEFEEMEIASVVAIVSNNTLSIDWEYSSSAGIDADYFVVITDITTGDTISFSGNTADLPILITDLEPGMYEYVIYMDDICYTTYGPDSFSIMIGIEELSFGQNVMVYPNPSNDFIIVEISSKIEEGSRIQLLNLQGQIIYQNTILHTQSEFRKEIDVSNYSPGVYLLKIDDQNNSIQQKIIIN